MKKKNNPKESNNKAEAARVRKFATVADRKERESKSKEDDYWRQAEGAKSRAAKKREEEAEKRADLAAKKAEARRLAELEEKELARYVKKPDFTARVTEAELLRRKEEEKAEIRRKAEEEKKRSSRIVDETEYERIVTVPNVNRGGERIEASTVDDAIVQMAVSSMVTTEKNPEKRRKALFMAFEEAQLPLLKLEKPGLTQNQYKDMIWKMWKKSLDNPENQVKSSTAAKLSAGPVISERMENYLLMKVEINEALVKKGVVSDETEVLDETGDVNVDQDVDEADECCARVQVTLADYLFRKK